MGVCYRLMITAALGALHVQAAVVPYAQVQATKTNVYLGQVFNVDVVVKADTQPDAPVLENIPGFHATVLEAAKPTSETNTWFYRFAFRAEREGDLTIPALHFGPVATDPLKVKALKPEPTDRMSLRQELSAATVYAGQPIRLTTTWDSTYPFGSIKAVDFHFPVLNDSRFQVLELFEPVKENAANATGLPVHGTRVLASRNSYSVGDVQHQSLSFSKILIPKKSGEVVLPPATLLCAAEKEPEQQNRQRRRTAFQYPAYFDNTFFDQNVTGTDWTRIYTESAPVVLNIKPLPENGRPDLFNGMVGEFKIDVAAEPVDVRVGEPVTLTIRITAQDFMENIFLPPLRYQPLLVNRFEIPSDRSLPQREGKAKIYTQTIRALSTAVAEVPPLQLTFFSPASNAYVTVQSDPIPLKVAEAAAIAMTGGTVYGSHLHSAEEGIRHNSNAPDILKTRTRPFLGWAHPAAVALFLLFPPLVVGGLSAASLLGEKKHHIHRTAKAARAFKVFRRNVAHIHTHTMKTEIYCDLDEVLRAYLGDRLHLNPGALSFRDAESRLLEAGADGDTLEELKALFARCEAYRFTSEFDEEGDARHIVREATRIVKNVERSLK